MQLRWTEEAANDLERIADYLVIHAPCRADCPGLDDVAARDNLRQPA
jgi:plasmid stabilization system protein ParE